jgi:ABC-type polysaccharide/polyol phosphate export permease
MKNSTYVWGMLGWHDLRQAYRRSALGPFWITAGMGIQIATMGVVFSLIFQAQPQEYVPFLAVSIILWMFMASSINESCLSFISAEGIIKQLDVPLHVHVFRVLWKNILNLAHNLVIIPVAFLVVGFSMGASILLFVPGFALLLINLGWMSMALALMSARFRDTPPIITSLMTVAFYVTPVMWYPSLLPGGTAHLLLGLNPFYHLLQIVRLPVLGQLPTLQNWYLSALLGAAGWGVTLLVFKRLSSRVAYWV